jgi:hypothetical protein
MQLFRKTAQYEWLHQSAHTARLFPQVWLQIPTFYVVVFDINNFIMDEELRKAVLEGRGFRPNLSVMNIEKASTYSFTFSLS